MAKKGHVGLKENGSLQYKEPLQYQVGGNFEGNFDVLDTPQYHIHYDSLSRPNMHNYNTGMEMGAQEGDHQPESRHPEPARAKPDHVHQHACKSNLRSLGRHNNGGGGGNAGAPDDTPEVEHKMEKAGLARRDHQAGVQTPATGDQDCHMTIHGYQPIGNVNEKSDRRTRGKRGTTSQDRSDKVIDEEKGAISLTADDFKLLFELVKDSARGNATVHNHQTTSQAGKSIMRNIGAPALEIVREKVQEIENVIQGQYSTPQGDTFVGLSGSGGHYYQARAGGPGRGSVWAQSVQQRGHQEPNPHPSRALPLCIETVMSLQEPTAKTFY